MGPVAFGEDPRPRGTITRRPETGPARPVGEHQEAPDGWNRGSEERDPSLWPDNWLLDSYHVPPKILLLTMQLV